MSDLLPTGLKIVRRFSGHHNGVVKCAQWRNCANVLASCGNDKLIHVYDVRAPDPIHTFAGYHECAVNSVSWDPSCEFRFLSAAFDTKINVFDMRMPAEQFLTLQSHSKQSTRFSSIYHPRYCLRGGAIATNAEKSRNITFYHSTTGAVMRSLVADCSPTNLAVHAPSNLFVLSVRNKISVYTPALY
eukprot:TRINITY_DN1172_c0_g1_i7.p1 TRINITY_DN1172_c0_g1~~TRINITY_DN1172_c0_g1_i7.p1  ORF type:complete len:187 (-),score=32.25 TRINITY_DN1172_c0_g1_i7:202-762(-)